MRHTVHLFMGKSLAKTAKDLLKYMLKYGESEVSSYFNTLVWNIKDNHSIIVNAIESHGHQPDKQYIVNDQYNIDESIAASISANNQDEQIKSFFTQLYNRTLTINNQGDSNKLLLVIYLPLYDECLTTESQRIIDLLDTIQPQYSVDIIGLAPDLEHIFENLQNESISEKYATNIATMKKCVHQIVEYKKKGNDLKHFIFLQNCNAKGVSLALDQDSVTRILGEFALLTIEKYNNLFNVADDIDQENPVITFGLSMLSLDKYYFVQYLLRKAYLHILERECVSQKKIDVNKVSQIAQKLLIKNVDLLSNFIKKEVNPLLEKGISHNDVIVEVTPRLEAMFNELSNELQSFIANQELTLPEKKVVLAQLLGQDDEHLLGNLYNKKSLTIDDLDFEAAKLFVDENNRCITRTTNSNGEMVITPFVLTTPENESGDIFIPIDELKQLQIGIRESTDYIRRKNEEIEGLKKRMNDEEESGKRLTDKGFIYNGTTYHLLNDIEEVSLEETYEPHDVAPRSKDLRPGFTKVKDQGVQGSCASFSIVSIYEYMLKSCNQAEYDLSESFVYYNARKRSGREKLDEGTSYYDVITSIGTVGVCSEKLFPYDENIYNIEPDATAYDDALSRTIKKAKNVRIAERDIKSAVCDGYPVAISLKLFNSFGTNTGFVQRPTINDIESGEYGFHGMVICGYNDEAKVFIVRNSWGEDFGEKGYCYIPYSYITDSELSKVAYIITEINQNCNNKEYGSKAVEFSFNMADTTIKREIIRVLLGEEEVHLAHQQIRYARLRTQYDTLMQTLGNNTKREQILQGATEKLEEEILKTSENYDETLNKERPEALKLFDKVSLSIKVYMWGFLAVIFITGIIIFYYNSYKEWITNKYSWIYFGAITVMMLIISIFYAIRKRNRKELEAQYADMIIQKKQRIQDLQNYKNHLHLKTHLAGMIIDRLLLLQNLLTSKYLAMKSYVGNLTVWEQEEKQQISSMEAFVKNPFIALLNNDKLNSYFESNKDNITEDVYLYKYLDKYDLSDEGIKAYKETLNQTLTNKLFIPIKDFSILKYIKQEEKYPFLTDSYSNIATLLPMLNSKSECFLQYSSVDGYHGVARYLFIHLNDMTQRSNWEDAANEHFTQRPLTESFSAENKIVVVQMKRIKEADITLLKM